MKTVSLFFTSEATVWMLSTEKRTYGPCRFSVSFPNARLFLEQGAEKAEAYWNPCYHHFPPPRSCHLDWVHIVHRNKWLWLTGCIQSHCRKMFSESAHLSQPTAPLPPGHELRGCFKVKITTQVNKDFKNRKARKRFEYCSQTACYSSTVTQH